MPIHEIFQIRYDSLNPKWYFFSKYDEILRSSGERTPQMSSFERTGLRFSERRTDRTLFFRTPNGPDMHIEIWTSFTDSTFTTIGQVQTPVVQCGETFLIILAINLVILTFLDNSMVFFSEKYAFFPTLLAYKGKSW